jgi:acetyl-CoA hydrolase
LEEVEIIQVLTIGPAEYVEPAMAGHIRVNSLFISANVRKAVNEGRADFTPILLSQIPHALRDPDVLRPDAAMIHCSPPDEHGFCTYGVEVGLTKPAAESAKTVIAEVNDRMPRSLGDSFVHVSRLTHIVPVSYPIVEVPMGAPGDLQKQIASHIAELIPDGATMQMGIGEIPDAVLLYLHDKRDLGVHTELFSDGVIELIESGVLTNAAKTIHRGKIISGFALGSQRLYDYMDNNPLFEFHPQDYVNDPFVIAQNAKQVALNSALEVDLTGQVCADSIGTTFYSGVGGQLDFIYGASRSPGGLPIIALPATAKDGAVSRIVPTLKLGAGVVTTRNHVHYVVTEYGAAALFGKSIRQRVHALIGIAAPQFRDELTHFARQQHWI